MKLRLLLILTSFSLSACMLGPNYERPELSIPEAYQTELGAMQHNSMPWWTQYEDTVLNQLVAEALAHNRNIQIAIANIEAAAGVLTSTRAPIFPQFSYGAEGSRSHLSEASNSMLVDRINPQKLQEAAGTVSWEIDLWGKLRRQTEAAQANLLATQEAQRGVVLSLVSGVTNSYLQLRSLDRQLEVSQKTRSTYEQSLRYFELQFKYGQTSAMTVTQARSQYETASAQIPLIEQQIAEVEHALSVLLGRNPGPIARGKTIDELAMPQIPEGLPSELLERRPDIAQAEQQLIAANAQIGAAKALYFPAISLTGNLGSASSDLSDLFSGPARTWSYSGSLIGPIFTAGLISGQVTQAKANQKAAALNYQQVVQQAFADVENALSARKNLIVQTAAQKKQVTALQEYAHLAHLQFDGGYSPYSTVLQAEEQLFPAELNLAATKANGAIALANIYKALGGDWIDQAQAMRPNTTE